MRLLDELALKHGTDKSSIGHGYTRWYECYWVRWRKEPLVLLEIGVGQRRASIKMWEEWAPAWRVFGIDNDAPSWGFPAVAIGDQNDAAFLLGVIRNFGAPNIIIDDGSHEARGQITSFETLFPKLQPGGWYCVEDLHTSFPSREGYGGLSYFKSLADAVCGEGRFDLGEPRNLPYFAEIRDTLPYNVRWIESVTFYPNLCMIRKREEAL